MKKYIVTTLILLLLVSLMSSMVFAQAHNEESFYIDSRLPEKDRKTLREIMMALDEEDRENVLHIYADGRFTANRLELIEEFKKQNEAIIDEIKSRMILKRSSYFSFFVGLLLFSF